MKISSFIALRYFFSRKSSHAVNIITGISVGGILVGAAALIIVLSAFNGLENMVRGFYNDFDPDLKVTPKKGKFFDPQPWKDYLQTQEGLQYAEILEERALFTFRQKEHIATIKGVDSQYDALNNIEDNIIRGDYYLGSEDVPQTVLGAGVAYYLGYSSDGNTQPLKVFVPRDYQGLDARRAFKTATLYGAGVFSIQPGFDEKYALVSLPFARDLLNLPEKVSALEINVNVPHTIAHFQKELQSKFGDYFHIKNRDEQQAVFFKVLKTEGLFTFLIFALILSIATLTIAGSLTMLMLEKRRDLYTYWALGLSLNQMRRVFLKEGLIICGLGGTIGLVLGVIFVYLQDVYGLISLGAGYAVESYPVLFKATDLLVVAATVFGLGTVVSWLTARRITRKMIGQ